MASFGDSHIFSISMSEFRLTAIILWMRYIVFFTRFSTLSGGIRLIFFLCTTFIWYESPMENYFIVHMYFFLWPFFFLFTRLFSLALLMWHTNQINSIQFGYLFWYVYIFYTLINCVRNIIHPWHKKYEIIAVSPFQTYVNFLCQKYYA